MGGYNYIAVDGLGRRNQGLREAGNKSEVLNWLREQGLTPVTVTEVARKKKRKVAARRARIKSSDLATVCWQLTTMVEGGVPITSALKTISEDIENARLRQVMTAILEEVEKGSNLSDGIAQFPDVFSQLARAIIYAGETSGNLAGSLRRLAEHYDNRDKLAKKVKGAMAYPIFVVVFILAILVFIMTFIIPKFEVIFEQMGNELPAFTQAFMNLYSFLKNNILFLLVGLFVFAMFCIIFYKRTEAGHRLFSKFFLRIPLFGRLISHAFMVTYCRTMSTLLSSGVSVLEIFDILTGMAVNDVIRDAISETREQVIGGNNVSIAMSAAGFFPNMSVKMVEVGEQSGTMPKVLERTAQYYERKVEATIAALMSLLEPVMIISVGGIVGTIVLALYLPIFNLTDI